MKETIVLVGVEFSAMGVKLGDRVVYLGDAQQGGMLGPGTLGSVGMFTPASASPPLHPYLCIPQSSSSEYFLVA